MRKVEATKPLSTKKTKAARLVTEWKHILRTNPKTGLSGSTFAALLSRKGFDTDFLMAPARVGDVPELLPSQLIEDRFFPMLKLVIQDNFLEVLFRPNRQARPALGEHLSYESGKWREMTEPRVETSRPDPEAVLCCFYCQKQFLAQPDGNIFPFTRHYIKAHWRELQRRSEQIRTAQCSTLPEDSLPRQPQVQDGRQTTLTTYFTLGKSIN